MTLTLINNGPYAVRPCDPRAKDGFSVVNGRGQPIAWHADRFGADHACATLNVSRQKAISLVDAAPDMLAALKAALDDGFLAGEALEMVTLAIAKAKGVA